MLSVFSSHRVNMTVQGMIWMTERWADLMLCPGLWARGPHVGVGLRRHILGVLLTAYLYQPVFHSPCPQAFGNSRAICGHWHDCVSGCSWHSLLGAPAMPHPEISPTVVHKGSVPTADDKRALAEKHWAFRALNLGSLQPLGSNSWWSEVELM